MNQSLVRLVRKFAPFAFLDPQGDKGIARRGHREYVGGMWDQIGQLQFDFLVAHGLHPNSYLVDIACGSLRLGVKAIPYLETGHYLGIEKERGLVQAGLEKELGHDIAIKKKPKILISDSFEFERLGQQVNFAIAQSLFTHLPPTLINLCFRKLRPCLEDGGVFFATYFRAEEKVANPDKPHDHASFAYTEDEMIGFGTSNDFAAHYIGEWNHPRQQVMVAYRKTG